MACVKFVFGGKNSVGDGPATAEFRREVIGKSNKTVGEMEDSMEIKAATAQSNVDTLRLQAVDGGN